MADLSRTIEIIFDGVDNLDGTIGAISSDLDRLSSAADEVTAPMRSVTESLLAAEIAAGAVAVAVAAVATAAAGDFSDAFNEIATLIDASDASLAQFKDDLQLYASTSTQSFASITEATYSAISAGVEYTDAIDALAIAEQLAVASKTDLNTAMETLVPTLNSYGAGMDEASAYSDVLFETVRQGKTTLPELGESLSDITPIANALGVPIEEVGAALATLTAQGFGTSEAATAISGALGTILSPSDAAADAAEALGIEMGGTALATEGLSGWLETLITATGGNIDAIASLITEEEALKGVLALTGDSAELFNENLLAMEAATGATATAFATMADNFELNNQRIINAVTNLGIEAGTPLEAMWGDVAIAVAAIFNGLADAVSDGAFDDIYEALADFADGLIEDMEALADNLPAALELIDWTGFIEAFGELGEAVSALFDGADLSTPEGLAEAIQTVVDVGEGLVQVTAGIVTGFEPLFDALVAGADGFSDLSDETQRAVGEFLQMGTNVNLVLEGISPLAGSIGGLVDVLTVLASLKTAAMLASWAPAATTAATAIGSAGLAASATLLGQAIGGAAAAWAGFEIGKVIADVTGLDAYVTDVADSFHEWRLAIDPSTEALDRLDGNLQAASSSTGLAIDNIDTFNDLVDSGTIIYDAASNAWVSAAGSLDAISTASTGAVEGADAIGASLDGVSDSSADEALERAGRAADAFARDAIPAKDSSRDLYRELDSLASDDQLKMMQFRMELEVADIQANAQIAVASIESLSETIVSTGDLLGTLFGLLGNPDLGYWDRELIYEQIELENQARQEALQQQRELTQATLDYYAARTEAIGSGNAVVTITGDGLEPHLEGFMWEILRRIQLEVNNDGLEMLVGL